MRKSEKRLWRATSTRFQSLLCNKLTRQGPITFHLWAPVPFTCETAVGTTFWVVPSILL